MEAMLRELVIRQMTWDEEKCSSIVLFFDVRGLASLREKDVPLSVAKF